MTTPNSPALRQALAQRYVEEILHDPEIADEYREALMEAHLTVVESNSYSDIDRMETDWNAWVKSQPRNKRGDYGEDFGEDLRNMLLLGLMAH